MDLQAAMSAKRHFRGNENPSETFRSCGEAEIDATMNIPYLNSRQDDNKKYHAYIGP